jgi:hypothetical protein
MTDTNMRIWDVVQKTNPAHTKQVNQRGGFTAISANYQIMRATEVFGPIGIGWGYDCAPPIFQDTLMIVPVTFWHGDRGNTFGPIFGCEEWKDKNGRVDSDAPKKAMTDGITKALSQLGFNADVFLGMYDDNKYVERLKREFAAGGDPVIDDAQWALLTGLIGATNSDAAAMCQHYKIPSLKEMTVPQFEDAKARLEMRLPKTEEKEAA